MLQLPKVTAFEMLLKLYSSEYDLLIREGPKHCRRLHNIIVSCSIGNLTSGPFLHCYGAIGHLQQNNKESFDLSLD